MTRSSDGQYNNRYNQNCHKKYITRQTTSKKGVYTLRRNNHHQLRAHNRNNDKDVSDNKKIDDNSDTDVNIENTDEDEFVNSNIDIIDPNKMNQQITTLPPKLEIKQFTFDENNDQIEIDNITKEIWDGNKQSINLENMIRAENCLNFLFPLKSYPVKIRVRCPIVNDIIIID